VEPWLERAQEGTPIIDGEIVTFVWHGPQPPQLIGDFTNWEYGTPLELSRAAPELWTRTLTFPLDAYVEYAFWRNDERLPDPLNPHTTPDGIGHHNHFFYMPDAAPTSLTRRRRNVPHGTVTRHVVEEGSLVVGGKRPVHLYQPPTSEPCPLLVVLDGQDYRRRAKLTNVVDNLIAQERIRPLALAMVDHAGQARMVEYACSEATLGFLVYSVLPLAQTELNLLDFQTTPGAYGILGASMGGLMALYAGIRVPQVFGHVLSQSGAFTFDEHDSVIWDLIQHGPVQPIKIWMDVGRFEWLLPVNQRMHDLLVNKGYDVTYREHNGGHNYPSWRNDVWRGLEWLFGPP
jgi:enterochelin esterase family protein